MTTSKVIFTYFTKPDKQIQKLLIANAGDLKPRKTPNEGKLQKPFI